MTESIFPSVEDFRTAAREAEHPLCEQLVRASFDTEAKAESESRTIKFTISTASIDRSGDTIALDGWRLDAYRKNPVVLWAHDASSLPLGKATQIWTESGKLRANAEFTPPGMLRFNDAVFEMYKQGFLNATSVGFQPIKYAFSEDVNRKFGIDFLEQELLEFSAVPVPANAEALIEGKAAGMDVEPILMDMVARAGEEFITVLGEEIAKRRDLFAKTFVERIAAAAGERLFNADIQRQHAEFQSFKARQRAKAKRQREITAMRLRGAVPR